MRTRKRPRTGQSNTAGNHSSSPSTEFCRWPRSRSHIIVRSRQTREILSAAETRVANSNPPRESLPCGAEPAVSPGLCKIQRRAVRYKLRAVRTKGHARNALPCRGIPEYRWGDLPIQREHNTHEMNDLYMHYTHREGKRGDNISHIR
jgi:hypothetical protein